MEPDVERREPLTIVSQFSDQGAVGRNQVQNMRDTGEEEDYDRPVPTKFGKVKYIGNGRIIPSGADFACFTAVIIIFPTLFGITYVNYSLLGHWGTAFGILWAATFINTLRILYLCATTEPGIIPRVKSNEIDYDVPYRVTYKSPEKITEEFDQLVGTLVSPGEAFFTPNLF